MNFALKEYKSVVAAVSVGALGLGGSAWFFWTNFQARENATQTLKAKSEEINRFRGGNPPATKENAQQLQKQLEEVEKTVQTLRAAVSSTDSFGLPAISPQDFQKALNEKAQALFKKAEKESVNLPVAEGETNGESFFYLSFKEFKSKPPSPEKAPVLNRQLLLTELILNLLLDTHPQSIQKFRLFEHDPAPPVPPTPPAPPAKAGSGKKDAKPEPPPLPPVLNAQAFEVHFTGKVESLRDFLNALATQKQAFFVTRNLRVANNKEKEAPPKESEEQRALRVRDDKDKGRPERPLDVVGAETVSVELTLESLTVPPLEDAQPKDGTTRK